ncbi:ribosomal protein L23 [Thraustotheca clavata]|uniref:Large ribosomal subunit protein uL23m n=1 Tax=Thraustotheca clavata TaxID=74557 RepID=A0A1V9ZK21_9STRA|nr:ribosomal protein L23 [Thraustotheca clavata]
MVWNRLRFPNMAVTYVAKTPKTRLAENQHIFRVEPNYTKHDIKEYLQKVYNLPVVNVRTMNYEGKFKRAMQGRHVYKEKDWKKAVVTLAK